MEAHKQNGQRLHRRWLVQVIRPTQLQVCCNRVVVDVAHKDIRYLGSFSKIQHTTHPQIHTSSNNRITIIIFQLDKQYVACF
jgi:hypothetical protein